MSPFQVTISEDRLSAWLEMQAPHAPLDRAAVLQALTEAGVVSGLDQEALEAALIEPGDEPRVLLASGTPSARAQQACIELLMDSGQTVGEKMRDGSIDFRERSLVTNVKKGQPVAVWHPATPAVLGLGVDGVEIPIPEASGDSKGREPAPSGDGLDSEPFEDGRVRLRAHLDGVLNFDEESGVISVQNELVIEGDVGLETGNITALGSLRVNGSVLIGSSIEVCGDAFIAGTIEAATLKVGGDLVAAGGIVGGETGSVEVSGNLTARHAQSVHLQVEGDVTISEGCMDVNIESKGKIIAVEGRGQLRGGTYEAAQGLCVKELGSMSGVPTFVRVGADPEIVQEISELEVARAEAAAQLRKLKRDSGGGEVKRMTSHLNPALVANIRRSMKERREITKRESLLAARLEVLKERMHGSGDPPSVDVLGTVYPGVEIQIYHIRRALNSEFTFCRFTIDDETGTIVVNTLPKAA